jgi:hypothetical protein
MGNKKICWDLLVFFPLRMANALPVKKRKEGSVQQLSVTKTFQLTQ